MEKEFLRSVHDYQKIIYKICRMYRDNVHDQEDLFQEMVYQLWKSYPDYKAAAKISSWIYRICLNTAMAAYRKPALKVDYVATLPDHAQAGVDPPVSENEIKLFAALRLLNNSEKALVSLYLEDFSYAEMSSITGLTESNIGVRLNRIKTKLKEILK